tara:strand:- start:161 stop:646 length:486 start_codon:yes stop_codon:yes gene_type:complete
VTNSLPDNAQVISATFNQQLLIGAAMIAVCVIIHGMGLFTIQRILSGERMTERFERLRPLSVTGAVFTLIAVFAIIFIHFVEIWLFAFLYDYLGALHSFSEALYFSTISYATIGYSDASIHDEWRMVAALEGVVGIILLGWSTAFFVRILGRLEGEDGKGR